MMRNLDWDDLRIFVTAARSGSLARSARALGVDHSTVSRRLTRLEYAMGTALLERGRDGVKLTVAGVAVLRRAEELAASIVNLRADMGDTATVGSVRLATMEGIASLWLTQRLEKLRGQAPEIRLELVTSPTQVRVTRREADLFLSFFRPPGRALISTRLGAFATQLWAAPEYLRRRGYPATPEALVEHDFVGYIDELVQVDAVRWLEELVSDPCFVFTSNSMIAQMGAARGGLGIVCLPSFAGAAGAGLLPVLQGVVEGTREVWLSVHADLARAPRIKTVTSVLRELIAADDAFSTG
jgi:DNA-binding transcriptional LysR family regulator